jgi:D-arabinose 1-dehydrogenase-like Zn-dependent alcohol dehydrogenase
VLEIKVVSLIEIGKPFEIGTVTEPTSGPTDVLVKVEACGLAPNSFNIVTGKAGLPLPSLPCIFGLDISGVIEAVGEHVFGLKPSDRVYIEPYLTCNTCHQCRRGKKECSLSN